MTVQEVSRPKYTGENARVHPVPLQAVDISPRIAIDRGAGARPLLDVRLVGQPQDGRTLRLVCHALTLADQEVGPLADLAISVKDALGLGFPRMVRVEPWQSAEKAAEVALCNLVEQGLPQAMRDHGYTPVRIEPPKPK